MLPTRVAALLLVLSLLLSTHGSLRAQGDSSSLLMVKLGDPGATQERAAAFLALLTNYLKGQVERFKGLNLDGYIANREADAIRLLDEKSPSIALVSPGFYLKYLRAPRLDAQVLAMVPRLGTSVDRYYLVMRQDARADSLMGLRGKTVRTSAAIDWPYLQRVVFPKDMLPGEHFVLEASTNLADDLYAMTESDDQEDAPDALLFDQELLQFFASDDLLWPQLKVIWTSAELSRDLVIALGPGWDDSLRNQCLAALLEIGDHQDGRKVLDLMQSEGFARPNRELLSRAMEAYDRAPERSKK